MESDATKPLELEGGKEANLDTTEENVTSKHALQSTWEDIYSAELRGAQERILYKGVLGDEARTERADREADSFKRGEVGRSLSVTDARICDRSVEGDAADSDGNSDISELLDGEEWFSQEAPRIAKWISDSLRTSRNHPLMPYFRALHSRSDRKKSCDIELDTSLVHSKLNGVCRDNSCAWCTGVGRTLCDDALWLPLLDIGCGNGIFLARLVRKGFKRLSGIDYSSSAIKMAMLNLRREYGVVWTKSNADYAHVCLRVADLRELELGCGLHAESSCICHLCSRCKSMSWIPDTHDADRQLSLPNEDPNQKYDIDAQCCTCFSLHQLPEYPVFIDKGTFDVFYLMHNTLMYVEQMSRLVPRHGLLFLTSCNCTEDELRNIFCAPLVTQGDQGCGKYDSRFVLQNAKAPFSPKEAVSSDIRKFEILDSLPHRSFEFGGVKGQVVTSLLFRRL